ncbi:hypothetical protein GMJAKD_04475 [Candidatus Electrothrix aarhusensis]
MLTCFKRKALRLEESPHTWTQHKKIQSKHYLFIHTNCNKTWSTTRCSLISFSFSKSELGLDIFHQQTERYSHLLSVCFLPSGQAIRYRLKSDIHDSWKTIREQVGDHSRITMTVKCKNGDTVHIRKSCRPEPRQQKIYDALVCLIILAELSRGQFRQNKNLVHRNSSKMPIVLFSHSLIFRVTNLVKLNALTPPRGRGKRQITEESVLQAKIAKILKTHRVVGLLTVEYEKQVEKHTKYIGRGRGSKKRPQRIDKKIRYQIKAIRQEEDQVAAQKDSLDGKLLLPMLINKILVYRKQCCVIVKNTGLSGSLNA